MRGALVIFRVLLAVAGGYGLSAAASAGLTQLLPRLSELPRAESVVLASMLGFVIYLVLLVGVFSVRSGRRAPEGSRSGFRRSMAALHTWAGVVLGGVLLAVFWMGTLSVFDREIDRWMMPATRLPAPPADFSLDQTLLPAIERLAPGAEQWSVTLPNERSPALMLRYQGAGGASITRSIDPRTGEIADAAGTLGGTGFIFPFHFSLHLRWLNLGIWLVGLAAMAMLVLVVSGVVIHVRFFREFFTFRPRTALTRSSLDLHTTLGVLGLPFHFVMPLSGLIIFFSVFFPGTWQAAYSGDRAAFVRDVFGSYQRPERREPAALGSLDAMIAQAERSWGEGQVSSLRVRHAGDAASYVELRRSSAEGVTLRRDQLYFDGVTGAELQRFGGGRPMLRAQSFIAGLHFTFFDHWLLRWLYFLAGLGGCGLIVTGFVFWLESRRARHARLRLPGVRVVEALVIGSVTGIVIATLAFFLANRLLPAGAHAAGLERHELEMLVFYTIWAAAFVHAAWRSSAAWAEQCAAIAACAAAAVLANWVTTGDHWVRALQRGAWSVAGMDAVLSLACGIAAAAARRLRRGEAGIGAPTGEPIQARSRAGTALE